MRPPTRGELRSLAGAYRRRDRVEVLRRHWQVFGAFPPGSTPTSLRPGRRTPPGRAASATVHVGNFALQAGDIALSVMLRDVIDLAGADRRWSLLHAHREVGAAELRRINAASGVVVGGGGLFLRDTNPNSLSGWQWACSLDALRQIEAPLAVYAVGFNRFPGQPDFEEPFAEHLTELVRRSSFFGLRNQGSIRAVRSYLPEELHARVEYQPCMTTLAAAVYPDPDEWPLPPVGGVLDGCLAVNCAFDRRELRYGPDEDLILKDLARAIGELEQDLPIAYFANDPGDEQFLRHLDDAGVRYTLVRLYQQRPDRVLAAYSKPRLVLGMRGHAQLIPFGCGTPIVSLVTHDKMAYFLEDLGHPEWGVRLADEADRARLVETVREALASSDERRAAIATERDRLLRTSLANASRVAEAFAR